MTDGKTFKQRNAPIIKGYVLLNIMIFFAVNNFFPDLNTINAIKLGEIGIISIAFNIIALILANVLPTKFKNFLVYWRTKNILPGCRAFTDFAPEDSRVNMKTLKQKLGNIPKDPKKQGEIWYGLLKEYEAKIPAIGEDHRIVLLFRDLTAISFCMVPSLGVSSFWFANELVPLFFYLGGLAMTYLLLSLSARNAGNRLVGNVLAQASLSQQQHVV